MDECYPLAFGVPAILMFIAVIMFIVGKPYFRVVPPKDGVVIKTFGCIFTALKNRITRNRPVGKYPNHWLDWAREKYDRELLRDVKQILPLCVLLSPLPVFWALYDQQGSRWTIQALKMDGQISGSFHIYPDMMQILNPVLILLLIPLHEFVVYPLCDRLRIPNKGGCVGFTSSRRSVLFFNNPGALICPEHKFRKNVMRLSTLVFVIFGTFVCILVNAAPSNAASPLSRYSLRARPYIIENAKRKKQREKSKHTEKSESAPSGTNCATFTNCGDCASGSCFWCESDPNAKKPAAVAGKCFPMPDSGLMGITNCPKSRIRAFGVCMMASYMFITVICISISIVCCPFVCMACWRWCCCCIRSRREKYEKLAVKEEKRFEDAAAIRAQQNAERKRERNNMIERIREKYHIYGTYLTRSSSGVGKGGRK